MKASDRSHDHALSAASRPLRGSPSTPCKNVRTRSGTTHSCCWLAQLSPVKARPLPDRCARCTGKRNAATEYTHIPRARVRYVCTQTHSLSHTDIQTHKIIARHERCMKERGTRSLSLLLSLSLFYYCPTTISSLSLSLPLFSLCLCINVCFQHDDASSCPVSADRFSCVPILRGGWSVLLSACCLRST